MPESPLYTPAIAQEICDRLAAGETLRGICRDEGMPSAPTVRRWVVDDHEGFAERYARARDCGLDEIADETIEISDNGSNDWMERNDPDNPGYDFNGEHMQRSRLRTDTRKWYLSKMAPKRYGDRQIIAGDPDAPLVPPAADPAATIASIMAAARGRKDAEDLA